MTKQEVLDELTKLFNHCYESSSTKDTYSGCGWMAMAGAISTAEDVAERVIRWEKENDGHTNIRS